MKRIPRIGRHLVIDARPLRKSRDLRCLFGGQLVIMLGGQLTTVAVPYQVYSLTRSSLDVGLVSLAQLLPLIAGDWWAERSPTPSTAGPCCWPRSC